MSEIKELIHYNEEAYNNNIAWLNEKKTQFAQIIALYVALGLPALTNEELPRLFHDTQELVIDKMISADITVFPAQFKRAMAKDWLVMPEGYSELEDAIKALKKASAGMPHNYGYGNMNLPFVIDNYELVDGVLQIKESVRLHQEESQKIYATTIKQVEVHAQLVIIANAMNSIKTAGYHYDSYTDAHEKFIEKAIKNNGPGAATRFTVKHYFVSDLV